ncbi:MAG: large conductance mechanosensitive channel protein MscL [Clostridia bacterium]|nr:large conductance mechanosensitive channel protein MscL [Clostridia bacterium]
MLKEFKEFALKGNVIDMAVGVIIGGAFQKIVSSLVNDIIMPLITSVTGKVSFDDLVLTIGNTEVKYGSFITTIIDFLIIAFSIFIAIRTFTKLNDRAKEDMQKLVKKQKEEEKAEEPTTKLCPYCLSEISIKATRCPHCTSELAEDVHSSEDSKAE